MSDLRFNVAQLLQQHIGATRQYEFTDPMLNLGEGLELQPISGTVKFTRTKNGVLAQTTVEGAIVIECVRCLTDFAQPVTVSFDEEYHATVHPTTGSPLPDPEEADMFRINSNHLLDLGDAVREYALLALPIAPICREDCRGLSQSGVNLNEEPEANTDADEVIDERLAALKQLLI
ncbi:MAG: DUF177 domain-containing protein [Herpetosiphonaceae bacterium]|nr:DUF177 domain-containing protein [Herpetosiphonaceae bacterium]